MSSATAPFSQQASSEQSAPNQTVEANTYDRPFLDAPDQIEQYRSVSKAAVTCLIFGVLSLLAFVSVPLLIFSLISVGFGLIARNNFKEFGDELMGRIPNRAGLALGCFSLVGAIGLHSYIYSTEVPEGYERINFRMLREDPNTALPYAEIAEELDGNKVFVRGYVRPGTQRTGLTEFILVGTFGHCHFGGMQGLTDVIAVRNKTNETVDYSLRMRRIGGTFRLNRNAAPTGDREVPRVYYQIDADYIR